MGNLASCFKCAASGDVEGAVDYGLHAVPGLSAFADSAPDGKLNYGGPSM